MGLVSLGIFTLFFRSSLFLVATIEVTGCQLLRQDYIREVIGVEEGKMNMFALRSWEIERRLERIPQIKEARVEKIFPHTLRVTITERRPEVLVEGKGEPFCIDREGVKVPCSLVPEGSLIRALLRSQEEGLLSEVLGLVTAWQEEFDLPLAGVEAVSERLFILRLRNGIVIKCEGVANLRRKAVLLRSYLRDVRVKSLKVRGFDLRPGEDIVIAPGEGEDF
ncbi:MAG: FtsQ-type POTRA domain-containing protein [Candidatus Caldatribacterium sp.]|nr:FtsQ-type POTRA domain-containing protein [Candidatus Caldatribacterium sp.]